MGALKTTEWDPAEYLESEEAIVAYLEEIFKSDDPELIILGIGDVARARARAQFAGATNQDRESLYSALSQESNPSFGTILKVLASLGLRLHPEPVSHAA